MYKCLCVDVDVCVVSEVDMRVRSEVWAVVTSRQEELLKLLNSAREDPETPQTLSALEGLALTTRLAALCTSPTK